MGPLRLHPYLFLASGGALLVLGTAAWWMLRRKPTPEERERARREFLNENGRITDGTIFDVQEVAAGEGKLEMVMFSYDVAGVSYEASQDVTQLRQLLDLPSCKAGLPTSVKYDPHNPGNSIVIAEGWSGLRLSLPVYSR